MQWPVWEKINKRFMYELNALWHVTSDGNQNCLIEGQPATEAQRSPVQNRARCAEQDTSKIRREESDCCRAENRRRISIRPGYADSDGNWHCGRARERLSNG